MRGELFSAIWGCKKVVTAIMNNSFHLVLMENI